MSTATQPVRQGASESPPALSALDAACQLLATDWSPWHMVLSGLSWPDYRRLLDAREDAGRKCVRITYANGEAEIMTVGTLHERWKRMLAALVDIYLVESHIPCMPCGGMTIDREDADRGFEPDECYYIRPTPKLLELRQLDFATDPPPDLAIEVEMSRRVIDRLPIYALFGIPEVWRFDGKQVRVLLLQPDGTYRAGASVALPEFPFAEVPRFLQLAETLDYGSISRQFRDWFHSTLPPKPSV